MKEDTILVVGGAGFIGSYLNKLLHHHGYRTIVLDNLSRGHAQAVVYGSLVKGDINDTQVLNEIFGQNSIKAVIHFAALTDVGESVQDPYAYYFNNVSGTLNLLHAMQRHGVNVFIFSSTASIFGIPQIIPIPEEHPCHPINPYGESKLMIERILPDFSHAYGLKYCCLRYFNAAGGDPEEILKNYKARDNNLIPIILRNLKKGQPISIFGTDYPTPDGTCIRDYIHVHDLGTAHIAAMEKLVHGAPSENYNLGNGTGFSVRDVIRAAEEVTGKTIPIVEVPRRAGDPPVLIANSLKATQELNWIPEYPDLHTMILHAWKALVSES